MRYRWAVGVTCVPQRFSEFLPRTLSSLVRAGWDSVVLFVDGPKVRFEDKATDIINRFFRRVGGRTIEVVKRLKNIGVFANWYLAAHELLCTRREATHFLIVQDDVVFARSVKAYTEKTLPEKVEGYPCYYNLYCAPDNEEILQGKKAGWYLSNQYGRGALALLFTRDVLELLLSSIDFVQHPRDAQRGHRWVDGAIVTCLTKRGYRECVHYPSLVQHLGVHSSAHGNRPLKPSTTFVGEEFDVTVWLEGTEAAKG